MVNTFYLVRHAHADWTPDENRPLSTRGREDAGRVADILEPYPIGAIYASPYRRARQTIGPLASRLGLPVCLEPDLRERELGDIATEDFFRAVERTWRDPAFAYPAGETNTAAQRRGVAVVQGLQAQYVTEHIVLATHGNLMALLLQGFHPSLDFAFWKSLTMPDIYLLRFDRDGSVAMERLWG